MYERQMSTNKFSKTFNILSNKQKKKKKKNVIHEHYVYIISIYVTMHAARIYIYRIASMGKCAPHSQ